jgi:hypothetical protein
MWKWILAALAIMFLLKRNDTPNAVTTAVSAPPEGNISTWGNLGGTTGVPDSPAFGTTGNSNTARSNAVPILALKPTTNNFRTRGFYLDGDAYQIPGRT